MSRARALVLGLLMLGCGSPLSEARTSFEEARYPDAVAQYRALKPADLASLERPALFEYALYRGLCHLALGDARPAERWLRFAKRLVEQSPGVASAEEQGRLLSAWRSMGYMPGD